MIRWLRVAIVMSVLLALPVPSAWAEERRYSTYDFPLVETDADGNPDFSKLEWVAEDKEEGNKTPLCQAVFAELKKGDDVRVNTPDFPRTPKTQSGLARIKWKNLDPQANFSTVMDILSYRFKENYYQVSGHEPTSPDGMEQLKSSYILKDYEGYAKDGSLILQQAFFDADGDGVNDRVLRMGQRLQTTSLSTGPRFFVVRLNAGDIPSFQFMIYFRDAKGREIRSGFDSDGGNIGELYKSLAWGAFRYKGKPFFFGMGHHFVVLSVPKRDGSAVDLDGSLCSFFLSPKAGEMK